jgi:FkbM family methyltransferase
MPLARPLVPPVRVAGRAQRLPLWAWSYYGWQRHMPAHRGKSFVLRRLHAFGLRHDTPFLWRMSNGAWLALRAEEGLVAWETVGWTCFLRRDWEPHVERYLRATLQRGDAALDVGANLGYFTAVMAQAVGVAGRVWSLEPTPRIADDLAIALEVNGYDHVELLRVAAGDRRGTATINFDPRIAGSSSIVAAPSAESRRIEVPLETLDGLHDDGLLGLPRLIKLDVEGAELSALGGARALVGAARPEILFELNGDMSNAAGWTLADLGTLLNEIAPYRLYELTPAGQAPVDALDVRLEPQDFRDFVAKPAG